MKRAEWPRRQIGIKLDVAIWRDIKIVALEQDRTATEVVEDALREYTRRHRERISKEDFGRRPPAPAVLPETGGDDQKPAEPLSELDVEE